MRALAGVCHGSRELPNPRGLDVANVGQTLDERPWEKYLDRERVPADLSGCFHPPEVVVKSGGTAFLVTHSRSRANMYQRIGQPTLLPNEVRILERELKGSQLDETMIGAIAITKRVLGGEIIAARSLERRE